MASRRKSRSRSRARAKPRRRLWPWLLTVVVLLTLTAAGVAIFALDTKVRARFEGERWALPARVLARPDQITRSMAVSPQWLDERLARLGYRSVTEVNLPGSFVRSGADYRVGLRGFQFGNETIPERIVDIHFDDSRIGSITDASTGQAIERLMLDPEPLGTITTGRHEDRDLVHIEDVPDMLVAALLTVEDKKFLRHYGIDPRGILRAAWENFRSGRLVAGGSTITQQLVKNLYLSPDRSIRRKLIEMVMAMLLEVHYSKQEILEAYLNEVYLGQSGDRAIHGFGLASQHYFSRPLNELSVHEIALLVGMIKGPSLYNPVRNPQRARERRDLVLSELYKAGRIDDVTLARTTARPLGVKIGQSTRRTEFPGFVDLVRRQLTELYDSEQLARDGLQISTTLVPSIQRVADQALAQGLDEIERDRELDPGSLQGAVIVVHRDSGEVLAVSADRNSTYSGFNRALDARRPIGSLIKPVVYLTALSRPREFTLASMVVDRPLTVKLADGNIWQPQNYDKQFRGEVTLVNALVKSYNIPAVRTGMSVGLNHVVDTLGAMGVDQDIPLYPSILLGALELTPFEVAQVYQTLASGGRYARLHSILSVQDQDDWPLAQYRPEQRQSLDAAAVALVDYALTEVVRRGTGAGLNRVLPPGYGAAGKTGTTDSFRDSWFAGYSGNLVAITWVGKDDNESTGLTGSSGAMRIWGRLFSQITGFERRVPQPDNLTWTQVDLESGLLADNGCPDRSRLPFIGGSEPDMSAPCANAFILPRTVRSWWERLTDGDFAGQPARVEERSVKTDR